VSWLKYAFFNAVHEGFAEFLADWDLFAADEDLVVADGFEAGDIHDIGIMDAGEGGGELFFNVLESTIDEQFVDGGHDPDVFFFRRVFSSSSSFIRFTSLSANTEFVKENVFTQLSVKR
jgi:hypothetical protein